MGIRCRNRVWAVVTLLCVTAVSDVRAITGRQLDRNQDELSLAGVLSSSATPREKEAACAVLRRVGTKRSVPALAALLADEDLSEAARYALESMPFPEAGTALIEALDRTGGLTRAGIIHSLGRRREVAATAALGKQLGNPDPEIAGAAATALARIGGPEAHQLLLSALSAVSDPGRRGAVLDALLKAANRELNEGRREAASRIFERLFAGPAPDHVRTASYRGMLVSASPARSLELLKTALQGGGAPIQTAAIVAAREMAGPGVTRVVAECIARGAPALQISLVELLRQRGDRSAAPTIVPLLKSQDASVRVAAIRALGELGDSAHIGPLLDLAASGTEAERAAARQALLVIKGDGVASQVAASLAAGSPSVRVEAARALAARGDASATETLARTAEASTDPVRRASLSALGQLVGPADVPLMIRLITVAVDDTGREQAADALRAALTRMSSKGTKVDPGPIVDGLAAGRPETREALFRVASAVADERIRGAFQRGLKDTDAGIREGAALALCDTVDRALLPDLLDLARNAKEPALQVQAVRAYIRLALDDASSRQSPASYVKELNEVLPIARPEERWVMLAGLARIPDPASLEFAAAMLDDPATRAEAVQAVLPMATRLAEKNREHARMALEKVLAVISEPEPRKAALAVLQSIDRNAGSPPPVTFRRTRVDGAFRSEGVAVSDFNRDGEPDIATGNVLYLGPDWRPQPMQGTARAHDPENYSDAFLCFAADIDKDGWTDLVVVGSPGGATNWLRNPGPSGGEWTKALALARTGSESPAWVDPNNDGNGALLFIAEGGMAFARPGPDPAKPWTIQTVAGPGDPKPPHGLGMGDINGDGRADVLCPDGWWERPQEKDRLPWKFHRAKLGFEASAQMPVFDVDGDFRADVMSSGAHSYGIWWYRQDRGEWQPNEIHMGISQVHALHVTDINGDGLPDLVTGKRFWAHRRGDPGTDDPAVLCWFELRRENNKVEWIRHNIDYDSGVGLHFEIVDLNRDGLPDIVTSNKKGVYTFVQERGK